MGLLFRAGPQERYALDGDSLKPYFEINKVLENGIFYAANQLYGVTFKERKDIPTWNPDMRAFEVHEENGKLIGLMLFDYWKRDNKQGGAWMSNLVNQSYLRKTIPVIYNVGNFAKPAAGQPALICSAMSHHVPDSVMRCTAVRGATYTTLSAQMGARLRRIPSQSTRIGPRPKCEATMPSITDGAPITQQLVDRSSSADVQPGNDWPGGNVSADDLRLA